MGASLSIERIAVVAAALAAGVFFAVALAGQRALESAQEHARNPGSTRAERDAALRDSERAARLRPLDGAADVVYATLLSQVGREREGIALIEDVVRREPENLDALFVTVLLTFRSDPERAERARRRVIEIDQIRTRR